MQNILKQLENSMAAAMLFLLFLTGTLSAQHQWEVFTASNSGLSYNTVYALSLDSAGGIWVGTVYGLNKYQGGNWTNWYQDTLTGLPTNDFRSLACDSSGTMWIGTLNSGLLTWNGSTFQTRNTQNSGMPDDYVRSLAIGPDNRKWVGTSGGLAVLDGTSWTVYNTSNSDLESNNIAAIDIKTADTLGIGTINGGFTRIEGSTWTVHTYLNSGLSDNSILGVVHDPNGSYWLATPAGGMINFDGTIFANYTPQSSSIPTESLKGIELGKNGDLWIATIDDGLLCFRNGQFLVYDSTNSPMPDNNVNCLHWDESEEVLWVGTQNGGLVKLTPDFTTSRTANSIPEFALWPVPASERLNLQVEGDCFVQMFDLQGKSWFGEQSSTGKVRIEVADWPAGLYIAKVKSRQGISRRKIWIQH